MNRETYQSPLATRYCSEEMRRLFSDQFKYTTWRRLWIALAEARAAPRNRAAYRRAADALAAARQIAEQSGELATWDNAFAAFRAAHRRQSALWEEVAAAGVELAS